MAGFDDDDGELSISTHKVVNGRAKIAASRKAGSDWALEASPQ